MTSFAKKHHVSQIFLSSEKLYSLPQKRAKAWIGGSGPLHMEAQYNFSEDGP
jgi:hypothetical protein